MCLRNGRVDFGNFTHIRNDLGLSALDLRDKKTIIGIYLCTSRYLKIKRY